VRAFPNEDVVHEEGEVDPLRDMGIINNELILKDLQHLERVMNDLTTRLNKKKEKKDEEEFAIIERVKALLDAGKFVKDG